MIDRFYVKTQFKICLIIDLRIDYTQLFVLSIIIIISNVKYVTIYYIVGENMFR